MGFFDSDRHVRSTTLWILSESFEEPLLGRKQDFFVQVVKGPWGVGAEWQHQTKLRNLGGFQEGPSPMNLIERVIFFFET